MLTEFAPRQGDFAVVAAAVSADVEDVVCRKGRVVLGGVGPLPVEVDAAPLSGQPAAETSSMLGSRPLATDSSPRTRSIAASRPTW